MRTLHRRLAKGLGLAAVALAATACLPAPLVRIDTVAGTGAPGFSGDGGPAVSAQLYSPSSVAIDGGGNVFVSDVSNMRIRQITPSGAISTIAGTGTSGFGGDGGPATAARLSGPQALGFDAAGNLYLIDHNNLRIRRIDTSGTITTVAGTGTVGYSGDGGPATAAALSYPSGLAVAGDGTLYISDPENHVVRRVGTDGVITTIAGTGSSGFVGDGGPAIAARLNRPGSLAVDGGGVLYIADTSNNRVRRVDASGTITTVAGNGTVGFSGDGGPATTAQLASPTSLALDRSGNLLVGQGSYHVIRLVVLSHGLITRFAGTANSFGAAGDGGPPTSAQLFFPAGMAVDPAGDVLVADSGNHRIRFIRTGGSIGGTVTVGAARAEGVTVRLYRSADRTTPVATTTTDANGEYGFQVLTGDYVVELVGDGTRLGEWWNDAADAATADVITVGRNAQQRADAQLAVA